MTRTAFGTGAREAQLRANEETRQITIAGSAAFVAGERIEETTKSGRSRAVSIDADTVQTIKGHRQRQNADRLAAGDGWKGAENKENGHVFTTAWGEPIHPDSVSSLMASLTARHNKSNPSKALPPADSTTYGRSPRRRCSWPASRSPSSRPASATPTRPSRSGPTRM